MKCPRCQHDNHAGAKFCEECAAPLTRACANCGAQLSPTAKFCSECAHPTGSTSASTGPTTSRFTSPETYTPKHLAERILTSKAALEGERKQVTVLFADLKGSMELLADRDPEEARKLLDPVLERMMEAVHRYEGTVNQVMGDGIMALFGAPLAHEDHAVRACYAALRMQESVRRYAESVRRAEGIPIQIRVGLNSGEVVVRSIGSDLHMDYTAVGQTTHVAARMEQMATAGSILIPPETLTLVEGYVMVKPLGPMPVKGLEAPIEVYEMTGAATVRSRLHVSAARGLTRFVGRDGEMDQLRQALDQARAGHGQVAAVMGEPGVGKSRLFWEFTHSHRTEGWLIVESSSVSYGKATTFLPLIDLLRTYFQIETRDEARKVREKVTGKLFSLDRALEPSLPAFLWLLDLPVEDPQWENLDPSQRRQRTLDGVKRLLLRESQVQPVLVLFEDLHWIDAETQALLDSLVESLPAARLLLLVNYRPEYQHGWSGKTYYRQLRIDALPPASADELLEGLLGSDPGLQLLKRLLIERTGGNPFFLEESVRTLVETNVLAGDRGAYRLAKASQGFQIPATAQGILASRIDRLSPEDKRLLQAAAVIGKDVPFDLLQAIADGPEDVLRTGLTHLLAGEFLYEARLFPDLEYTFKHALMHEVVYEGLLHDRRRALHGHVADTIERLHAGRLEERIERLAHHAVRGELWEKAVHYCRRAGERATSRSASHETVGWLEQALAALEHAPDSRAKAEAAVDLRLEIHGAFVQIGEMERALRELEAVEALSRAVGDHARAARASMLMAFPLVHIGLTDRAVEAGRQGLAFASESGDLQLEIPARYRLGSALYFRGSPAESIGVLRPAIEALEARGLNFDRFGLHILPSVGTRVFLAASLAQRGEFSEATRVAEDAIQIASSTAHAYSLAAGWGHLGWVQATQGRFDKAVASLERSFEIVRTAGYRFLIALYSPQLGAAYAFIGRSADAFAVLDTGLQESRALHLRLAEALHHLGRAEALLACGRLTEAADESVHALEQSRGLRLRAFEAATLLLVGQLQVTQDPSAVTNAEKSYSEALALAAPRGMRPLVAHCHLGLGKVYRRTGKRQEAQEHLTTASTMYREMGMTYWLEKI
jgi:class 3 adenylate cyclase/tetratricopeptide (TPR) repeat protein